MPLTKLVQIELKEPGKNMFAHVWEQLSKVVFSFLRAKKLRKLIEQLLENIFKLFFLFLRTAFKSCYQIGPLLFVNCIYVIYNNEIRVSSFF